MSSSPGAVASDAQSKGLWGEQEVRQCTWCPERWGEKGAGYRQSTSPLGRRRERHFEEEGRANSLENRSWDASLGYFVKFEILSVK